MCCTFITTSECVPECFSLRVDRSLTKTNGEKKIIISMNVLSAECVSRSYRTHCEYTHTPECRRGAFRFFFIFSDSVEQHTLVCAGCASFTFSFLFFFVFFLRVVQFNKVLNVTVKVRSKL